MEQDELKASQEVKVEGVGTPDKVKSFRELLETKEIEIGDKIAFTGFGGDKETIVTVDQAFLDLPILEETYYKQFNYRIYEK